MLLTVKNLKTYLDSGAEVVRAVDGISFDIKKGETFCLVGESGSGKSITALSIIQLIPKEICHHPEGQIWFNYRHNDGVQEQVNMLALEDHHQSGIRGARIAMIFQEPMTSLNPVYTIGDQIIEALQLHWPDLDYDKAKQRAIEALAQVQISDPEQRVDEYPHRLSGGQRQRVMLAMAMACEPDLLIADEPTTALDVTVQAEILRLMKDLQERKDMGILFITHDFGVVAKMAHKVAVMRNGVIVEAGSLQQILKQPKHHYTQELLAALPENMIRARAEAAGEGVKQPQSLLEHKPILEVQGLKVHFPVKKGLWGRTAHYVKAVDDIDLNINEGEIVALVGESGCGKTTLGRALLRLIEPTAGTICFAGTNIVPLKHRDMQPFRTHMQMIFQDPMSSLNPRLNIATTLTEPMAVHAIGENQEARLDLARQILLRVQLSESHLWRYPHEFSGGQRQRIGIARALVLNPKFIVCDEVTSALDVSVQSEILQMLLDLRNERQLSLLFITHDIGVVEYVSDRMVVMNAGKIVEQGLTDKICHAPQEAYTQQLLAAVPRLYGANSKG